MSDKNFNEPNTIKENAIYILANLQEIEDMDEVTADTKKSLAAIKKNAKEIIDRLEMN